MSFNGRKDSVPIFSPTLAQASDYEYSKQNMLHRRIDTALLAMQIKHIYRRSPLLIRYKSPEPHQTTTRGNFQGTMQFPKPETPMLQVDNAAAMQSNNTLPSPSPPKTTPRPAQIPKDSDGNSEPRSMKPKPPPHQIRNTSSGPSPTPWDSSHATHSTGHDSSPSAAPPSPSHRARAPKSNPGPESPVHPPHPPSNRPTQEPC